MYIYICILHISIFVLDIYIYIYIHVILYVQCSLVYFPAPSPVLEPRERGSAPGRAACLAEPIVSYSQHDLVLGPYKKGSLQSPLIFRNFHFLWIVWLHVGQKGQK